MAFICWLAYKWARRASHTDFRTTVVLFWVLVFDLVHFILTGNDYYFKVGFGSFQYAVTNNVLMLIFWFVFAMWDDK